MEETIVQRQQEHPADLIFIQSRAEVNLAVIEEYAEMMEAGVEFDPVQAIEDEEGGVYVWDGAHRGEAARKLDRLLPVEIRAGTRAEAEWLALGANQKHGLRRSRADKRYIVRQALLHPAGISRPDREIARHCGVDHKTVGRIRQEMEEAGEIPRVTGRLVTREDGTQYQLETGREAGPLPPDHASEGELDGEDDEFDGDGDEGEFDEGENRDQDGKDGHAQQMPEARRPPQPEQAAGPAGPQQRSLKFAQVNRGGVALEVTIYVDGEAHQLPVTAMFAQGPISGLPEMSLADRQQAALILPVEQGQALNLLYLDNLVE